MERFNGHRNLAARRSLNNAIRAGGKSISTPKYRTKYGKTDRDGDRYICVAIVAFVAGDEAGTWQRATEIETQLWARANQLRFKKKGQNIETPILEENGEKKKIEYSYSNAWMHLFIKKKDGSMEKRRIQGTCLFNNPGREIVKSPF